MKLLWNADLKLNTVHVDDLCKAIWHVCGREDTLSQIYNVVDDGNTTQGLISEIVSNLFHINHDYWGNALSTIVKVSKTKLLEVFYKNIIADIELYMSDRVICQV